MEKNGVNISKKKYVTIYNALLDSLAKNGMSYSDIYMVQAVKNRFRNKFEGSIGWYVEDVKLDQKLEK
jgi:hypothetical protein